jgi:hypothetical protein
MANEGYSDETLIRGNDDVHTVVLVGNGAVDNGGVPLRATLDSIFQADSSVAKAVAALRMRDEEALHQLAIFSYKCKIARGLLFTGWAKHKKGTAGFSGIAQTHANGLPDPVKTFLGIRKRLSDAYLDSSFGLSLREDDQTRSIIGSNAHFITTNWDNCLWNEKTFANLIQFHGRAGYPDSLVFPTELLVEDAAYDMAAVYTLDELKSFNIPKEYFEGVVAAFRSANIESLLAAHGTAGRWLAKAKKVVIWGYSLGDYDADVNAMVATYTPPDVSKLELVVINPELKAFHRAVALTGITNATHHDPIKKTTNRFS